MSTTKSKPSTKTVTKDAEPKPKYHIGQKVFLIEWGRSKAGEVYEAEISTVRSAKMPTKSESGKTTGSITEFEYDIVTCAGFYQDVKEYDLYPSITTVSIAFAKKFTHLLK